MSKGCTLFPREAVSGIDSHNLEMVGKVKQKLTCNSYILYYMLKSEDNISTTHDKNGLMDHTKGSH